MFARSSAALSTSRSTISLPDWSAGIEIELEWRPAPYAVRFALTAVGDLQQAIPEFGRDDLHAEVLVVALSRSRRERALRDRLRGVDLTAIPPSAWRPPWRSVGSVVARRRHRPAFTADPARDSGLEGSRCTCREWWRDATRGLRARPPAEIDQAPARRVRPRSGGGATGGERGATVSRLEDMLLRWPVVSSKSLPQTGRPAPGAHPALRPRRADDEKCTAPRLADLGVTRSPSRPGCPTTTRSPRRGPKP